MIAAASLRPLASMTEAFERRRQNQLVPNNPGQHLEKAVGFQNVIIATRLDDFWELSRLAVEFFTEKP
jgi:uncharacterized protein YutE (UPF0331/DUF86 family)